MPNKKEVFKPHHIDDAIDLPDLWFRAIYDLLKKGRIFEIDKGSYQGQERLEYDFFTGRVAYPEAGSYTQGILPQIPPSMGIPNPVEFEYIYGGPGYENCYIDKIMTSKKEPNESYTYGERLTKAPLDGDKLTWWEKGNKDIIPRDRHIDGTIVFEENGKLYLNQIEEIIYNYKNLGFRSNQEILQVAEPTDKLLKDPPCLRYIDTRIQDNMLHFIIYFRSWDLWGGLPANLAGIEFLQKYMASSIGVEQGVFIVESKGLHLYDYVWEFAEQRTQLDEIINAKKDNNISNKFLNIL
jgi:thymidylate synthase